MQRGWQCPDSISDPQRRLDAKFRNLSAELKSWSARQIGVIKEQLLMAREIIFRLDQASDSRTLNDNERSLRADLKGRCLGLSSLERTIAWQRARVRHIAEGDANTKYFHLLARSRRRRNIITQVRAGDEIARTQDSIEEAVSLHYASVFGQAPVLGDQLDLEALGFAALDLSALDLPFTADEVWAAIRELPSDRAPGLDSYNGAFYKSAWTVIQQDIMEALNALLFGDNRAFSHLNSALVVLLPKRPEAATPTDYRPITMIHSFAKLVSKLLAIRLAPRLQELVAENQNAFIKGRLIHNNFKFVQRVAVLIRRRKIPGLLLKLDISKAFDSLAWPFLLQVLQAYGFSNLWQRWIAALLSTATSRILVNGQPGRRIAHRRGVRQGDSLSPMLFILAMEVLSRLFNLAQQEGIIRGVSHPGIRHICSLYADDVVLFAHPSVNEASAIKELLRIFGDASGLRTNLAKCSITEIHGAQETLADIQQILGCQIAPFPIRYLGLPLGTTKLPKAVIQASVDAVAKKMPTCHGQLMARSGRLVWIKSMLSAVPIYCGWSTAVGHG